MKRKVLILLIGSIFFAITFFIFTQNTIALAGCSCSGGEGATSCACSSSVASVSSSCSVSCSSGYYACCTTANKCRCQQVEGDEVR